MLQEATELCYHVNLAVHTGQLLITPEPNGVLWKFVRKSSTIRCRILNAGDYSKNMQLLMGEF
jgi:hypothetical protein